MRWPSRETQDGNAPKRGRVEAQRVAEVQIERYQGALLVEARSDELHVCGGRHPLLNDRRNVVSGRAKKVGAAPPEVLVELEFHSGDERIAGGPTLRRGRQRNVDVAFARHLRAVGDARQDVFSLNARIIQEDIFERHAVCEEIKDERHPDTVPSDAWLAEAHIRVNRDSRQ
jgi:hypothetical protein